MAAGYGRSGALGREEPPASGHAARRAESATSPGEHERAGEEHERTGHGEPCPPVATGVFATDVDELVQGPRAEREVSDVPGGSRRDVDGVAPAGCASERGGL